MSSQSKREVVHMPAYLAEKLNDSRSRMRRVIAQGGVKVDGEHLVEWDLNADDLRGRQVTIGKTVMFRADDV